MLRIPNTGLLISSLAYIKRAPYIHIYVYCMHTWFYNIYDHDEDDDDAIKNNKNKIRKYYFSVKYAYTMNIIVIGAGRYILYVTRSGKSMFIYNIWYKRYRF